MDSDDVAVDGDDDSMRYGRHQGLVCVHWLFSSVAIAKIGKSVGTRRNETGTGSINGLSA